jgi:hypothetical protein
VGLGPATVVRLEGALAHGNLHCCADEVPELMWLDESAGPAVTGRNRKPAPEGTGMRKRPSAQAPTTVREQAGQGQTAARPVPPGLRLSSRRSSPPCSSCLGRRTRWDSSRFRQEQPNRARRFAGGGGALLPSRLRARSPLSVHSLWITVWMDPVRWSRDNDRAELSQATRSGVDHR